MFMVLEARKRKKRKALKSIARANLKDAKSSVKFCYGLTIFLRVLAVVLAGANILYILFVSKDAIDAIFLIMTFGFPFALSFLPAIVYTMSTSSEYRMRRNETVKLMRDYGLVYCYQDNRAGLTNPVFTFSVQYNDIKDCVYNEKTKLLRIRGKIIGEVYENGELKSSDEYTEISFLDVYGVSIQEMLKNASVFTTSEVMNDG